jgi:hypothetical protein
VHQARPGQAFFRSRPTQVLCQPGSGRLGGAGGHSRIRTNGDSPIAGVGVGVVQPGDRQSSRRPAGAGDRASATEFAGSNATGPGAGCRRNEAQQRRDPASPLRLHRDNPKRGMQVTALLCAASASPRQGGTATGFPAGVPRLVEAVSQRFVSVQVAGRWRCFGGVSFAAMSVAFASSGAIIAVRVSLSAGPV